MNVSCNRTVNGAWVVSAVVNGYLVVRCYHGYTKRESIKMFKAGLKGGSNA